MIVRISGSGQYDLPESAAAKLAELDELLTSAIHAKQRDQFRQHLLDVIQFVQQQGTELAPDRVVPSDVIVPPEDVTLEEAGRFFTDEGLMHPLPA